jgi:ATP-dependent RNA helicase DDX52/ROK1
MDDLFNILTATARIDKSKRKKPMIAAAALQHPPSRAFRKVEPPPGKDEEDEEPHGHDEDTDDDNDDAMKNKSSSRDRTGKRDKSSAKLAQVHIEQITAFRRSMNIRLANSNKHDGPALIPDPITRFDEMVQPPWWLTQDDTDTEHGPQQHKKNTKFNSFVAAQTAILRNVEKGRWKEPTPIQMQGIPTLLSLRRDMIGAAPTGSGKSGAFLIPAILLAHASRPVFYGNKIDSSSSSLTRAGEVRALIVAPSLELAAQLHREIERLGENKPGGVSAILLAKTNATQVIGNTAGGKRGVDILVATPMRLVDAIQKGLRLDTVRLVVLDEADRLLDASDGGDKNTEPEHAVAEPGTAAASTSGSAQTQTFLSQMDIILAEIPATAVRALFSATVTPMVRSLAESILRHPLDVTVGVGSSGHGGGTGTMGGANPDIEQQLLFVGKEEGKLLAIRQLVQRGQLRPPVLIFLQSQDRAQALFIHVDVIHAGRTKTAREAAVAKFRTGETWVLICTDLVARGVDFKAVNMVINYDLCPSSVTYVHRIGRTGRAGRKGQAITLFTEADFDSLRAIANVMRQSGCEIPDWMLNMKKSKGHNNITSGKKKYIPPKRRSIDTTPIYDKRKKIEKRQMTIEERKKKKAKVDSETGKQDA